ncbi:MULTISPECIES: DUF3224 domain-containing protein [Alteromonadaceae]|uniref:DUF3224 domain-containing protein n=1 Tax=Alteromonadaceae TaxID=72275 RepID=UPI001C090407|nr:MULTISPECIES: DUF3224 domain-containing protein [Aliiglaciecola]MBU2878320.1 DUF3224 domain-containing protein [Aliiglaciecola lipolytica]MDO6711212.1 DUF3224 domain-containing protein [Aliiglaciecola sp. 2_MG-2023]MDO6752126.1 DUF3224 domain-containing protein [Aliiglaciecola sp. 1_MG-2023]
MHNLKTILVIACFCILGLVVVPYAQVVYSGDPNLNTENVTGEFEVIMQPQTDAEFSVARMTLDKTYHGELDGQSKGQMLSHMTEVKGSAGYVALESFTGTLDSKHGSFVLIHQGIMNKGEPSLAITVVPDSGSGELTGIVGTMNIEIKDTKHFYIFDYKLP